MSNIDFLVSKAQLGYYASLPGTNDALILVPIEATGLEADSTLAGYASLGALLAASNNEQTTMGRKTLSGVTVNTSASPVVISASDVTYTAPTGNAVGAVVICYDPDTTTGTDTDLIPLGKWDYTLTPSGADVTVALSQMFRVS